MELVFATNNTHKTREIQAKVKETIQILTLNDIGCTDDIEENGKTLEENASIKSRYVYGKYGKSCFGDDTGLEIEALNNEPGVFSARYSGSRDTEKNMALVLEKLKGQSNRNARFRTVISLIINGDEKLFIGEVKGRIRERKSGVEGFGYDPIFQPEGYACTFAEMSIDEKNSISHRGKAVDQLLHYLNSL